MFDENKLQTFLKKQAVFLCIMPKKIVQSSPLNFLTNQIFSLSATENSR